MDWSLRTDSRSRDSAATASAGRRGSAGTPAARGAAATLAEETSLAGAAFALNDSADSADDSAADCDNRPSSFLLAAFLFATARAVRDDAAVRTAASPSPGNAATAGAVRYDAGALAVAAASAGACRCCSGPRCRTAGTAASPSPGASDLLPPFNLPRIRSLRSVLRALTLAGFNIARSLPL